MKLEPEKILKAARALPKIQQVKMALIAELAAFYQCGIKKVPRERLADYMSMTAQVYAAQFADCVILDMMKKIADDDLQSELVLLATEEAVSSQLRTTVPQLNNIRKAIFDDFK